MSSTATTTANHDTVRAFYADILSSPATTTEDRYYKLFSPDVVSIPTPPGGPGAQARLSAKSGGVFSGLAPRGATWGAEVPGGVGGGACRQAVGGRVGL